ncbi:hypothetical protein A4D02_19835 [Niastella koreensis]|uniref:Phosphoribosylpyrophosphate synthetase n=2 Tax=Niastella koreensis TaxID=354356 RepID=G8TIR6_NIAKG|nr:hypothetical protein [Niastella koreensis]AEV96410.1 hypothetical protein Niako_0008 [Niastella koreensis GR20-10]OQP53946.1 hypothetical protein A4D02_19835 [Niastella koreensis]
MNNDKSTREMDTISTVLNTLKLRKQDNEFIINETGQLSFNGRSYDQHDIKIINTYRFEGESDPADAAIIYLIMAYDGVIGYSLDAYGVYTNHRNDGYADIIQQMAIKKPLVGALTCKSK